MAESLTQWLKEKPPDDASFTATLAGVAERVNVGEEFFPAIRDFLDEAALMPPPVLQKALNEEPPATGKQHYDAYLGALAEFLAGKHGLERPEWSIEPGRFLETYWFPSNFKGFRALAIVESPAAFRRRCIFISAGSLIRV